MPRSHPLALPAVAAAVVGSLALLSGCGGAADGEPAAADSAEVVVADGWVRATAGTEDPSMTGAFMQIANEGPGDVTLVGASTDVADRSEIHQMLMQDGAMTMKQVEEGFDIPAGELIVLQPGGDHVMLMGLTDELLPGDEVTLTLEFDGGRREELTLPVKAFTEEEGHYHETDAPSS